MNDADIERLTDEITTLCGHLDAAEYRLLELRPLAQLALRHRARRRPA